MDRINAFFLIIVFIIALTIFGCTNSQSSNSPPSRQEAPQASPSSLELPPEPKSSEPKYQEVQYINILTPIVSTFPCYKWTSLDACGFNAWDCEDDKGYFCLQNVTVKAGRKLRRIE